MKQKSAERFCVIGAGNIGTLLAAELAAGGHSVTLYTSRPEKIAEKIEVLDGAGALCFTATGIFATASLEQAVTGASILFITHPAPLWPALSRALAPFLSAGQVLLTVPGGTGEFAFSPHLARGCVLAGLQRVHSIARLKEYGKSVCMLGRKAEVQLAAIPGEQTLFLAEKIGSLLALPCRPLQTYLVLTLTPSNPILHSTRLYSMFREYRPGVVYDYNSLFYEEWTDDASRLLLAADEELQRLCARLAEYGLPVGELRSLREHYESRTPEKMTKKIAGIPAFRGLLSPMKETAPGSGHWVPDFSSRYFTADFSFGLKAILEIAAVFGVETPTMKEIFRWQETLFARCGEAKSPCFALPPALRTAEALVRFYLPEKESAGAEKRG